MNKSKTCPVCTGDGIAANKDGWCKCEECGGTGQKDKVEEKPN